MGNDMQGPHLYCGNYDWTIRENNQVNTFWSIIVICFVCKGSLFCIIHFALCTLCTAQWCSLVDVHEGMLNCLISIFTRAFNPALFTALGGGNCVFAYKPSLSNFLVVYWFEFVYSVVCFLNFLHSLSLCRFHVKPHTDSLLYPLFRTCSIKQNWKIAV